GVDVQVQGRDAEVGRQRHVGQLVILVDEHVELHVIGVGLQDNLVGAQQRFQALVQGILHGRGGGRGVRGLQGLESRFDLVLEIQDELGRVAEAADQRQLDLAQGAAVEQVVQRPQQRVQVVEDVVEVHAARVEREGRHQAGDVVQGDGEAARGDGL